VPSVATALVHIPGGTALQGSDDDYPEEGPAHRVRVADFRLARTPVTVAEFAAFVDDTGHVTVAERLPGSAVFRPPSGPVDLRDPRGWWSWLPGASWRHPEGPASDVDGRDDHPVVHVALEDALAYCAWAGTRLPTEAEWEHAARGGLHAARYVWGDEATVDGVVPANVWCGVFPWRSEKPGGAGTEPVGRYPPNGFGLLDVIGNVWELTSTAWTPSRAPLARAQASGTCCGLPDASTHSAVVAKGGSFLCSPDYCARYRPAARIPVATDSPSANVGFRCAADDDPRPEL
jgi:sulfatase modifying factor 1